MSILTRPAASGHRLIGRAMICVLTAATAACTTVESLSVSQIPEKSQRTTMIHAHSWSPMILFVPFGAAYIDEARADFLAQCPGGSIEGTLAKFEDVNYFIGLYATQTVTFEGYCVHGHEGHAKKAHKKGRA